MTEPSHTSIERTEIEDVGDRRTVRHWHPNGTLVEEERSMLRPDGTPLLDGTSSRWSSNGILLGSFDMKQGTGTQYVWYDNGQLAGENPMVHGMLTGLQRGWDESGYLFFEKFWYQNRAVSKKKYRELQTRHHNIPQYLDDAFISIVHKRKMSQ